ncbi:MAG TPA: DUF177 domain-containing protein [Bacteroidota bacterium]|nr:DUF177 domain-containing protein [Bacteroidota bacterium]
MPEGSHEYAFETLPADITLDNRFIEKIRVRASLEKASAQLLLRAAIEATARFACDRCLDEYETMLATTYTMMYVVDERSMDGVRDEDELRVLSADTNYIDLDDDVRQFILLTVPQKLLCNENCLGICSVCGGNKNHTPCECSTQEIDSRWEALKKLTHN